MGNGGGKRNGGQTLIWGETLALVYDEEGRGRGMCEGKLDAGKASGKSDECGGERRGEGDA